ncbi:hypothetical protein V6N13_009364 [Hibiscus sabdariffa]
MHDLGVNMTPLVSPNSLIGPAGYTNFLANPVETNTDALLLIDNMGLSAIPTTILPTQFEDGFDNEMGKSFLKRHLCCLFLMNGFLKHLQHYLDFPRRQVTFFHTR